MNGNDNLNRPLVVGPEVRDITGEVMDELGQMQVLPASYWAGTTVEERAKFGHLNGIYGFPTVELVEYLTARIAGRKAIEIGAGHGGLARALKIRATDSWVQDEPGRALLYQLTKQPRVTYGRNVLKIDANTAVRRFTPDVVIGSWISPRWSDEHQNGNADGVDELDLLDFCSKYILIGNEHVHSTSRLWTAVPWTIEYPDWLYSRAHNGTRDFIATFTGKRAAA